MTAIHRAVVRRHSRTALRLLAAGCLAVTLAGCYQTQVAQVEYPNDYRQRHPITLREGVQTVEVMLGRNRGGLNQISGPTCCRSHKNGGARRVAASYSKCRMAVPPTTPPRIQLRKFVPF